MDLAQTSCMIKGHQDLKGQSNHQRSLRLPCIRTFEDLLGPFKGPLRDLLRTFLGIFKDQQGNAGALMSNMKVLQDHNYYHMTMRAIK